MNPDEGRNTCEAEEEEMPAEADEGAEEEEESAPSSGRRPQELSERETADGSEEFLRALEGHDVGRTNHVGAQGEPGRRAHRALPGHGGRTEALGPRTSKAPNRAKNAKGSSCTAFDR